MPELPEVETIRRTLARRLHGARIAEVHVRSRDVIGRPDPETFTADLEGARFAAGGRRGKYLLFALRGDRGPVDRVLIVHLRMTGQLVVTAAATPEPPHTHVIFALAGARGGTGDGDQLRFRDVRRFGRFYLYDAQQLPARLLSQAGLDGVRPRSRRRARERERSRRVPPGLFSLGPEPLSRAFTSRRLASALAGRRVPIKAALLDQRVVAGLGNIYADEALFRARVHPARAAGTLDERQVRRLLRAVRRVLRDAIDASGTTLSDYVDGEGGAGRMRDRLRVYGREGEPCPRCGTPVADGRVAGRGTRFCPACQPDPEGAGRG